MQPFEKLDGSGEKIHFRSPSVADYRQYCEMPRSKEQMVATQYLNDLQIAEKNKNKEISDSANWTYSDRIAALYWIYINTRERPVITQMYFCRHCNQEHGRELDLLSLAEGMTQATVPMKKPVDLPKDKKGYLVPLFGYAMEHLEPLKEAAYELAEESKERGLALVDIRLYEVAYSIRFDGEDVSKSEAVRAKERYDYLMSLDAIKEFQPLLIEVRKAHIEMLHGLASEYREGEVQLVTPKHKCPVKEGSSTELLLSFHCYQFLPNIH